MKSCFPCNIIRRAVNQYLCKLYNTSVDASWEDQSKGTTKGLFKLPYIGPFFPLVERKIKIIAKTYCKDLDIWLAFTSYKWSNMFSVKESIPIAFSSQVVYNLHVQDVIRVMSVKTLYILVPGFVSTYSRIAIPISLNIFRVLIDSDSS